MPVTVRSRCQRFDLRRVEADVMMAHLRSVCAREGVGVDDEALVVIARAAEGSVRDALSLLDQASVLGAETVDEAVVTSLIGAGRSDVQYALADAVAVGDAKGVFELVSRLVQEGQDLRHVTNEVLAHFRNLLLVKTAPGQSDLLDVTDQGGALDVDVRQHPVEPLRHPPRLATEQRQHRGNQRHPDHERVDEHPHRQTEGDRLDRRAAVRDEGGEHRDHDHRRSGHHPGAGDEAGPDGVPGTRLR